MPWCDDCERFWTPNAMDADGTCPTCGRTLERPTPPGAAHDPDGEPDIPPTAPWHFWLLVVAVVGYLAWRALQGLGWVAGQF